MNDPDICACDCDPAAPPRNAPGLPSLAYRAGDYVVIPKGTTHRWVPSGSGNRHFVIETPGEVRLPKRYQSSEGQLLEHAPYWERDFRRPNLPHQRRTRRLRLM